MSGFSNFFCPQTLSLSGNRLVSDGFHMCASAFIKFSFFLFLHRVRERFSWLECWYRAHLISFCYSNWCVAITEGQFRAGSVEEDTFSPVVLTSAACQCKLTLWRGSRGESPYGSSMTWPKTWTFKPPPNCTCMWTVTITHIVLDFCMLEECYRLTQRKSVCRPVLIQGPTCGGLDNVLLLAWKQPAHDAGNGSLPAIFCFVLFIL